jgi:hypothetical protein
MMATNETSMRQRQRADSFLDIVGRLLPSFVALERRRAEDKWDDVTFGGQW